MSSKIIPKKFIKRVEKDNKTKFLKVNKNWNIYITIIVIIMDKGFLSRTAVP